LYIDIIILYPLENVNKKQKTLFKKLIFSRNSYDIFKKRENVVCHTTFCTYCVFLLRLSQYVEHFLHFIANFY